MNFTLVNAGVINSSVSVNRWIIRWLLCGCVLIMMMVIIGGITRLTHSGLSMVKWSVFGSVPPMSQEKWEVLFDQYKQSPEFRLINSHYNLDDFKSIFWWEFIHRFLGRIIGLVFIVPFLWFAVRKQLPRGYLRKLILLLGLGGLQGVFGWIMVKSGLNRDPHVSHYLLALHLATAFTTFAYTLWLALDLLRQRSNLIAIPVRIKRLVKLQLILVSLQIVYGAFVAGLKAGFYYPQFPMMGDHFLPPDATYMTPMWKNMLENPVGVQFIHRILAMLITLNTAALIFYGRKSQLSATYRKGIQLLAMAVVVQFTLGVMTLLMQVPVSVASVHQLGAFFLLAIIIYLLHEQAMASKMENSIYHQEKTSDPRTRNETKANAGYIFSPTGIRNNISKSECKYQPGNAGYEKKHGSTFPSKLSLH